ncbi:MAG: response regulator, partial [Planctomycetota bacterium]
MSLQQVLGDFRVLVVDDEEDLRRGLERLVSSTGASAEGAASAEEALERLAARSFDLVLTDVRMTGMTGVELLREIKLRWPAVEVVLITGYGTIETAVSSLQAGAAHFLTKPFDNDQILELVETFGMKAVARRHELVRGGGSPSLIAVDPKMVEVVAWIDRAA